MYQITYDVVCLAKEFGPDLVSSGKLLKNLEAVILEAANFSG